MAFDIIVFDDDFRYHRQLHIDAVLHKALFRKLVSKEEYPYLHLAADDKEDLVFEREDVATLKVDVLKLVNYLKTETLMAPDIKAKCLGFAEALLEACDAAIETNHCVDFIAGE